MKQNPLEKLETFGQSIWLDYIRRDLITSGELERMIEEDGLRGMTSNPSIFEKAIAESNIYDGDIHNLSLQQKDVNSIYETISQQDVKDAADKFKPLYDSTGEDGYVSLEVNPHLAHNTNGTIDEARRLWTALNRPNVLIKVPGTSDGLPAIKQLISDGININVTLLFGLNRYREVAEAYIEGLEARVAEGKPLNHVASVASFFLSRIDSVIDPKEEDFVDLGGEQAHFATNIRGQVAISSAKVAYKIYKEIFESERFIKLAHKGASPQKLLWASTSSKNPNYSDIKYIEALVGFNTINTIPLETLEAYRDHGNPSPQLESNLEKAYWVISELAEMNIDLKQITIKLEDDGVEKFITSFDKLIEALRIKSSLK